jgi:hypothetical protein
MPMYEVFLSGTLYLNARVEVEANSPEEAESVAMHRAASDDESIEWINLDSSLEMPPGVFPSDAVYVDDVSEMDEDDGIGSDFIET